MTLGNINICISIKFQKIMYLGDSLFQTKSELIMSEDIVLDIKVYTPTNHSRSGNIG